MSRYELAHHGVLGMRWGVRKARTTSSGKNSIFGFRKKVGITKKSENPEDETPKRKPVSEMSDEELKNFIVRLELEKKYKDIISTPQKKPMATGVAKFVMDVLSASAKNVATQTTTYLMGSAINKTFGKSIVNVKGEKDSKK